MPEDPFEAAQAEVRGPGGVCWYRKVDLSDVQRAQLDAALANPEIQATVIGAVVSGWVGSKVGESAVRYHRRRRCTCG